MKTWITVIFLLCAVVVTAQENIPYQRPVKELADLVEAPLTPAITISPDRAWMVMLDRPDYPSIEELSRPELRIAGMRINPENFGPSRASYFVGIKAKKLADNKDHEIANLPSPLLMSDVSFSPDGRKVAFLQNDPGKIELWVIDMTTLSASRVTARAVSAVFRGAYDWLADSRTILFRAVPENREKLAEKPRVPSGPVIEENLGKKAPNRTYQDLLNNAHDEGLFDYYATSELIITDLNGTGKLVGPPAIYASVNPSPDGALILTKTIQRPYSYIVPASRFPQKVRVIDTEGNLVRDIADIPLADNIPTGFSATITGPRNHSWRADQPATLYWVEAQDGGNPRAQAEVRDKVFQWPAPFSGDAAEMISLPLRYAGVVWADNGLAWVYEYWWSERKQRIYQLDTRSLASKVIVERSTEDVYNDPGDVVTAPNRYGRNTMLITSDDHVFLTGDGSSPEGDMPFLDKMNLKTGKKTRVWQCEAPYYEYVVRLLDPRKVTFITSRESTTENPNYFLRTGKSKWSRLTAFPHPYPQLSGVTRQVLRYKREDGVDLTADLYLPAGYKKEDGPLPTFLWAYPVEFKSKSSASQVKGSPHTFIRVGWGSAIFWVTRGYAILNNTSIPIVGEGDAQPNDTYIQQLVSSARAAIDYGASLGVVDRNRVGVGGHSYGAFMTGNLLAHSNLFKAGIARSGAYNRTLTPFGFQAEERTYWEAPEVYFQMSPFSFADRIEEPILIIHGEADNNSGTFPVQSERFYNAIKGHGGTARFVMLPYESHGYRARESILHMLWEMDRWLEKYVKGVDGEASGMQ